MAGSKRSTRALKTGNSSVSACPSPKTESQRRTGLYRQGVAPAVFGVSPGHLVRGRKRSEKCQSLAREVDCLSAVFCGPWCFCCQNPSFVATRTFWSAYESDVKSKGRRSKSLRGATKARRAILARGLPRLYGGLMRQKVRRSGERGILTTKNPIAS